nr:hypothetical protein RSP597_25315 [Ralstonia solanacearum]
MRCPGITLAEPRDAATTRQFNQAVQQAPRLFSAILAKDESAVRRDLAQGDDPNACAMGASLLSQAIGQGYMEIAERLMLAGASLEHPRNAAGETVLLHTVGEGQWELTITVGKSKLVMKSDGSISVNGHTLSVGTSGEQVYNADGNIVMNGKKIQENG